MPTLDEAFDATFGATPAPAPAPLSEKPPRGLDEAFNATFGSGDTKLKATLTDAMRRDPVKTARAHTLSKRTGLHPDAVVNSLMDVEMQQAVADADVLLQTDASMLKRFRDQPLFAAKAQKDLKALIELHGELKGFKGPEPTVMNIIRGLSAVPKQMAQSIDAGLSIESADLLESVGAINPDEVDRKQRQRELTQAQNASSYTRPEFETTLGSGLYGIGETAIRMAPALAAFAITKSPAVPLWVMGAQVQPESYLKYRERGATPGEATLGSTLETATELVTEIPTMNFMVKAFGKVGFGKFLSGVLGRETATEETNTLITDAIDTAIANPNKTWEQYLAERPSRALETLITTVGYSGLLAGASSMARRFGDGQAAAQYAQEDADRLKNAFAATKLVQMREHAPADFGSAIQAIADEEDGTQKSVFIDADVFNQAIEALPKDQLEKLQLGMPDVLAQVPNSLATGASIEVPIGALLATVTDTPLEDLFLQNSRANEHSLSLVEAKQASEQAQSYMATEAEKVMQQAVDADATQVSAEAVKSNILGQLATANRFTADVNETQATLIRDFYTTLAGRLGTTPEEAYTRFPLQITAENVAGEVLNSGEDIGREMADRIAADPGAAVAEYNALEESNGGQILNTDIARELSPQYRADRTRSADVHEASSAFVKKMYADRLAAPTPEGKEPVVLFTAGGTGAGKSTGLAKVGGLASTAEIIFDTNMNTFESADLKIQQALKAGRKASIVYTFRDPVEALTMGALPRATRMGRTVPLDAHEETHTGARLTMDQLAAKYAGNPDVEIIAIDNSKGRGDAEITALANIPQMGDNELKGKLHAALEEAYQTGAITEAIYRGTKGDVNTAGTVQPGSGETAGGQLEQQSATKGLTLEGYHFSKAPRPNLNTGNYGTGLQGSGRESYQNAEDKRLGQRLSFYVDTGKGIRPESGVGGIAHKVELTNIYDSNADPLRLRNGGQLAFESKVLDRGFSGYLDRMTGEQPGQVILLGAQSMKAEVLGPKSSIEGAKRVPAPLATPSQGRDIVADALRADKGLPTGAPTLGRWQELLAKEPAILEALTLAGVFDGDLTQTAYRSELIKDFESKTADPVYNQKAKVAGLAKIEKHLTPAERGKLRSDTAARFVDYFYSLPSVDEFAAAAWAGRAKRGWYRESAQAIAQVFGADAPRFAALLAAMSPQNSVQTNLLNTLNTWKNWIEGGRPQTREEIVQIMGRSVEGTGGVNSVLDAWINNSVRALTTENPGQDFLSGPKVDSFMRNLLGNVDEVTNDAWMANFALVDQKMFKGGLSKSDAGKGPGYLAMSAKVRHAAKVLTEKTGEEWTPSEVQETIWSWAKTLYEAQTAESSASDILYDEKLTDDMIRATPDFKGLFHDAKYEKILRDAGYGEELSRVNPGAAGSQATGAGGQAGPFDSATQSRHENNAASRLEILRRDGKPGAEVFAQVSREFDGSLYGLPRINNASYFPEAGRIAAEYMAKAGLPYAPPADYRPVNVSRAERIAAEYEAMQHNPAAPDVKAAYAALISETTAQYQALVDNGLVVEFAPAGQDPYTGNLRGVTDDIRLNNHMWVFSTREGFGSNATLDVSDNPMLAETTFQISGQPALANDLFRVVHDYFGHAKEGLGFRASGEENAWRAHAAMFSKEARRALTTETRGQNSWLNFGPLGEKNRTASPDATIYADQKVGLLPEWVSEDDTAPGVTVNIGLAVNDGSQLTPNEVNAALTAAGVKVQASTVRQSATEQTLVARLDRALTPDEANALSVALKQEAVAQRVGDVGELYGPKADLWKPFNPEYFLDLEAPLAQPARGTFNPRTLELSLLKDADLSTLSHELGHFFLEVMANVSTSANAPEAIVNDMATVLKWFGVKDIATWNAMTLDQKRPYHEKFAESWEQYLFEGNAPTVELKPMFRRFREWMVNVYRSLEEFARTHNTQLNDEVRAVFGRMVAAEDQIKEAERTAGMLPDFNATNEAIEKLQARTLRDLKWTVNARSKMLKRLQADVADKRKAVKDEVTAEVREQPEYKVQRFLKFGELDGEKVTGGKLSLPVLKEMYGEGPAALWRYIATNMVTVDKTTGLHPNMVAELFGFPNGDAMTRAIVEAFPEDTEIEGKTDQRLLERYGDLVTDKGIERAANLAIHNEVRARFVASELKAMREGMNPRGKTTNGGSVNVLIQAAKEFAQNLVSRRKINELKPGLHTAAEARAGRKADAAQSAGDTAGALTAKRDQLLSHYAAKYTYEAQDEVDKKLDYLRKFDKKSVRDKLPPDYLLQIDALLEQYDLRRGTTNKDITKRASLQAWVDAQLEMGLNPVVPQHILEDAALKSYKLLSVEEFRGLVDTVRNIEHLGRLKDKLLTLQDKRAFAAVVADVSNSILDNATKEHFDRVNAPTAADQAADLARDFFSSHRKISSLVRQMDGFADNGALWNVFSRTMNKAADTEASLREGATKRLAVIFKGLKGSMGELAQIPGIRNSLSLETRLAVALNWGNETNQQRVMAGDNWSQTQVDGILQSLTANQLHFVQNVWDFIDSYWPDIKAKEERVSGVAPEKVAAVPFAVKAADGSTVDMKGGYYPIKYDTDRSSKAEADDAAEITKQMMVGHYARATTRRGHTQARVDTVTRAVRKDINVIFQHVEQVAHDLAWHEWLIDATRLLRAKPIEQAIRNTVGPQVLREFTKAVTDIAAGDVPAQSGFERMINHVRQGATITGLGWNVMTSLLQPFGLSQSMVRIGPKWVGKGLARWIGGAARMEGTVKDIYAQSEFMRLRGETMNREMREILNKVRNKNKSTLEATYFYLIQKGQLIADVPTWLGQYEKAVAHGADEANAVAQADQAVRDAQGHGATSDLSRIQRGGPLLKLFTNFYSFFNTTFNLTAESFNRTHFKNPLEAGRFAVDMLLLYTVPSVLVSLMKAALRGDDGDDDELAAKLAREQLNYLFGTMVGLREASAAISGFNGYQGPAGTRFFSEATKLAKQIEQGEVDEAALKALNNTAGTLLHYPAGAINRFVEGYLAYTSGESDNPLAPVVGLPLN